MAAKGKTSTWKSADAATPSHVVISNAIVEDEWRKIVFSDEDIYTSQDMKNYLDTEKLNERCDWISPFLQLDERGGFLGQVDMEGAIRLWADRKEYSAGFDAWCSVTKKETREDGIRDIAYEYFG